MNRQRPAGLLSPVWMRPAGYLLAFAAVFVGVPYFVDHTLLHGHHENLAWVQNLPEVFAGVIGIAITVVAIIVELAATRYTPRIAELFFRDRFNSAVLGFYVISCIQCIWVSFQTSGTFARAPIAGTVVCLASVTFSLAMLLPYFVYVFDFLNPVNVVRRLTAQLVDNVEAVPKSPGRAERTKREVIEEIEQIADVCLNAIQNKDKGISTGSIEALRTLTFEYLGLKARLPEGWFDVTPPIQANPDFVSMTPEAHADLREQRLWLEMKVFRQYQMLYGEALNRMRDIDYLIAISSRLIGERAIELDNPSLQRLTVKFFNTYMRQTINARDVRTAYNVLNQYRLLARAMLRAGAHGQVLEIARYFKFYGQLAFGQGLPFVLETVAYDLCTLNEAAHDLEAPNRLDILKVFLEVDKESEQPHEHEATLRGVRKAQVKLATYYIVRGATEMAREVFRDMQHEVPQRLASIKQELLQIHSKDYWEIIDRGANFDYLEPPRRAALEEFFGWFGDTLPADEPPPGAGRAEGSRQGPPAEGGTDLSTP